MKTVLIISAMVAIATSFPQTIPLANDVNVRTLSSNSHQPLPSVHQTAPIHSYNSIDNSNPVVQPAYPQPQPPPPPPFRQTSPQHTSISQSSITTNHQAPNSHVINHGINLQQVHPTISNEDDKPKTPAPHLTAEFPLQKSPLEYKFGYQLSDNQERKEHGVIHTIEPQTPGEETKYALEVKGQYNVPDPYKLITAFYTAGRGGYQVDFVESPLPPPHP